MSSSQLNKLHQSVFELKFSKDINTLQHFAEYLLSSAQDMANTNNQTPFQAFGQAMSALFLNQFVRISDVHFDGKGVNDLAKKSEYIEIENQGPCVICLDGWRIHTGTQHTFVFNKETLIAPGHKIKVYTFDVNEFSFKSTDSIWTSKGSEARLEDSESNLVSQWAYGDAVAPHICISDLAYDGQQKTFEGDEYVELTNKSPYWLDISQWVLGGGRAEGFIFPEGSHIAPNASILIYTNLLDQTTGGYTWESQRAIWSNDGGRAYLIGLDNKLVDEYDY